MNLKPTSKIVFGAYLVSILIWIILVQLKQIERGFSPLILFSQIFGMTGLVAFWIERFKFEDEFKQLVQRFFKYFFRFCFFAYAMVSTVSLWFTLNGYMLLLIALPILAYFLALASINRIFKLDPGYEIKE